MSIREIPIEREIIDTKHNQTCIYRGVLHNERQPSIVKPNGDQWWYIEGQIHRNNDLPAYTSGDGRKAWFQHGECHRDNDQPAQTFPNGKQIWYQHGKCHRDNDQPAVIDPVKKIQEWWVRGVFIRKEPL